MSFSIIAAIGLDNELGVDQKLLCHLPQDLKYFKSKTIGKTVIMGSKTYRSISHPLPDRKNIILSNDPNLKVEGVEVFTDYQTLVKSYTDSKEEIMIIGGSQIYSLFLPFVTKLYITKIHANFLADVFFPDFKEFSCCTHLKSIVDNGFNIDFLEYSKP
ncbi:MAG: dihydrofolate reductase [Candidatus Cloacimonetes bacterium]|nr:dihydrofolate reductase [Candidatus Cloacimonadota bacterium]